MVYRNTKSKMTIGIDIAALITAVGISLALVIKTITSSRCTKIDCCGTECSRELGSVLEMQ
jgi:hypothetical protein